LREIWEDPALFGYNRQPETLRGGCTGCVYGRICRGGCRSFTYASNGRFGDMTHCWYRLTR
jgi:radical SAM protein with 4Fe4S-binding SPASM domain